MRIIITLLISFSCFSQLKHTETDFYLENQKVYWQHIYEAPGKNIEEIIKYFEKEVAVNIKLDNFRIIDQTASFTINDDQINYIKYGGTAMGTVLFLGNNFKYLVVIDFKNEKYRVTVKEIFLSNNLIGPGRDSGYFEEYITRKKQTEFTENNLATKGMIYTHKYFIDKFQQNPNETLKKDW